MNKKTRNFLCVIVACLGVSVFITGCSSSTLLQRLEASGVSASQWEEAMAFFVEDQIYFELTGIHTEDFSNLNVTDEESLQNWIDEYHHDYWYLDSYPGKH